jgi:hypothetical protein
MHLTDMMLKETRHNVFMPYDSTYVKFKNRQKESLVIEARYKGYQEWRGDTRELWKSPTLYLGSSCTDVHILNNYFCY